MTSFGQLISRARQALDLSQEAVAAQFSSECPPFSAEQLNELEQGRLNPREIRFAIENLAEILKVDVAKLTEAADNFVDATSQQKVEDLRLALSIAAFRRSEPS